MSDIFGIWRFLTDDFFFGEDLIVSGRVSSGPVASAGGVGAGGVGAFYFPSYKILAYCSFSSLVMLSNYYF